MSNYGNPPTDPYGQSGQDPYGQQQPGQPTNDPYAQQQNPYGAQSYGYPSNPGVPPGVTFAHWGKRVAAYLIDALGGLIAYIPGIIGIVIAGASAETDPYTGEVTSTGGSGPIVAILMFLSVILVIAYFVWNFFIKQGRTGYTIGKGVMGIKLVKAETGQPIGPGMAFVRQLAHILDGIPCNLGYLWPLWDANRQTFADKVIGTYVIDQPKP